MPVIRLVRKDASKELGEFADEVFQGYRQAWYDHPVLLTSVYLVVLAAVAVFGLANLLYVSIPLGVISALVLMFAAMAFTFRDKEEVAGRAIALALACMAWSVSWAVIILMIGIFF